MNAGAVARAFRRAYLGEDPDSKTVRGDPTPTERWRGVHAVLKAYTAAANVDATGRPIEPLPIEVADFLEKVTAELLTGRVPKAVAAAVRPGAPSYGPDMMQVINWAVLYARAARAGLVVDAKPRQTVLAKLGIAERTWKTWQKRADPKETDPAAFWVDPDLADSRRAEMIVQRLEWAAEDYRRLGRPDLPAGAGN